MWLDIPLDKIVKPKSPCPTKPLFYLKSLKEKRKRDLDFGLIQKSQKKINSKSELRFVPKPEFAMFKDLGEN